MLLLVLLPVSLGPPLPATVAVADIATAAGVTVAVVVAVIDGGDDDG